MSLTVVGVFDNATEAQQAVENLVNEGFSRSNIDLSATVDGDMNTGSMSGGSNMSSTDMSQQPLGGSAETRMADSGMGSTEGNRTAGTGMSSTDMREQPLGGNAETRAVEQAAYGTNANSNTYDAVDKVKDTGSSIGNFFSSLFGGDDDEDTQRYNRVGERGSIVTVHAQTEDEAERAADVLDDSGAIDVNERDEQYTTGTYGATTGTTMAAGMTTPDTTRTNMTDRTNVTEGDQTLKVIREDLEVGKRTVETGGVRLRSRIVERPVEESVRLREERVSVVRNPVNRAATAADLNAFKEGEITMTERAEVPVVSKTANVVEEISVGKQVTERDEVIRDTVRNTDVDVEQLGSTDQTTRTDRTGMTGDDVTYTSK